jgi:hypothetical protein
MVSLEPGSDVPNDLIDQTKHLEASRSIFSSQCRQNTRSARKPIAKLVFSSKDIVYRQVSTPKRIGGAERDRTADPLLAKQVLSQLSYSPNHHKHPNGKPSGISIEPSNNQLRSSLPYRPEAVADLPS